MTNDDINELGRQVFEKRCGRPYEFEGLQPWVIELVRQALVAQAAEPLTDAGRLDWLEQQGRVALTRLRISAKPEATRYWCVEDGDDEDLCDGIEPEDRQTLRAAIDAARAALAAAKEQQP